jgi:hypothetical protein
MVAGTPQLSLRAYNQADRHNCRCLVPVAPATRSLNAGYQRMQLGGE